MASLGHLAVGWATARAVTPEGGRRLWSRSLALMAFSMLPDADVVGFAFGIPYGSPFGHRGASHSFFFAALVGGVVALGIGLWRGWSGAWKAGAVVALVVASHPVLDAFTDGGLGCALLWPIEATRYFWPWTPIPVAPIGRGFASARGLVVALTELAFFAPFWIYAAWPRRRGTGVLGRVSQER